MNALGYMFPVSPLQDRMHVRPIEPVFRGKHVKGVPVRHVAGANVSDLLLCQFGVAVSFTTPGATLRSHIRHVSAVGIRKQMIGSHAPSIVAMMANAEPIRYRTKSPMVSKAMGRNTFEFIRHRVAAVECAVSASAARTLPFPAIITKGDLRPKTHIVIAFNKRHKTPLAPSRNVVKVLS